MTPAHKHYILPLFKCQFFMWTLVASSPSVFFLTWSRRQLWG